MNAKEKTRAFLQIAGQFQLGHLITESFHPKTSALSEVVKHDVSAALKILQQVDHDALSAMKSKESDLWRLACDIQETLLRGNKVFMCGCGATGRLSLVLETLFRQIHGDTDYVISFMAGGDYALIKSVESFEDRVDYGERQLIELGFGPHDLLLSPTEGGETPFVIGATNAALKISSRSPWFLYCNPDELLASIDRSREVISNPGINKLNLTVGPMAISGSTRMQASTVLMLAIGVGLLRNYRDREEFSRYFADLLTSLAQVPYERMAPLTVIEASLYKEEKYLNYIADPGLAISILTDTTERSPTFSLRGFENHQEEAAGHSMSYLFVKDASTSVEAWSELLRRGPRALDWKDLSNRINLTMVLGFDISNHGLKERAGRISCASFEILQENHKILFRCEGKEAVFNAFPDPLLNHLMVKVLLNAHSTLIMGLMGRYEGNVMTYVRPSNNKLIDRAARYVTQILLSRGMKVDYEEVVEEIFEEMNAQSDIPVVLRVVEKFQQGI